MSSYKSGTKAPSALTIVVIVLAAIGLFSILGLVLSLVGLAIRIAVVVGLVALGFVVVKNLLDRS